jgi:hypothetical protein
MRRLLTGLVTVLALGSTLVGCSLVPQFACPAIGWINAATVVLTGQVQKVHTVELCVEGTCSVMADQPQQLDEPLALATAIPQATALPTVHPVTPPFATKKDSHTWTFTLEMGAPKAVTVRALSADGTTLAEREVKLSWKRVGGSEQCGGPVQTPPIVLSIPG